MIDVYIDQHIKLRINGVFPLLFTTIYRKKKFKRIYSVLFKSLCQQHR